MWKRVCLYLLGWLTLWGGLEACELPPFDPSGFRCQDNLGCLSGYICTNNVCVIALPGERVPEGAEQPIEGLDAGGEPSEAGERFPETSPEAAPERVPEPMPEPVPERAPEPMPEPGPEERASEPVPERAPEPMPEPAPEPNQDGSPESSGERAPETTPEP